MVVAFRDLFAPCGPVYALQNKGMGQEVHFQSIHPPEPPVSPKLAVAWVAAYLAPDPPEFLRIDQAFQPKRCT